MTLNYRDLEYFYFEDTYYPFCAVVPISIIYPLTRLNSGRSKTRKIMWLGQQIFVITRLGRIHWSIRSFCLDVYRESVERGSIIMGIGNMCTKIRVFGIQWWTTIHFHISATKHPIDMKLGRRVYGTKTSRDWSIWRHQAMPTVCGIINFKI